MIKKIKFTKEQRLVFERLLEDANNSFLEDMSKRPDLYPECYRVYFVNGYVKSFIDNLVLNGSAYLEV